MIRSGRKRGRGYDRYDYVRLRRSLREDWKVIMSHDDAGREELNRRNEGLKERLLAAPPDERDEIVKEIDEIARQLRELDLDDRTHSSIEGASEG